MEVGYSRGGEGGVRAAVLARSCVTAGCSADGWPLAEEASGMPWPAVLARSSWALVAVLLLAAAGGCRLTRSQVLMAQDAPGRAQPP